MVTVIVGCNKPRERTPEGTLSLLRDALVTGHPPLSRVTDLRVVSEARVLSRGSRMERELGIPLTERALGPLLEDERPRMDPQRVFAGARTLLRNGRCEKIRDVPVPDAVGTVPEPSPNWQPAVRELHVSVARRLTNAIAGEFRCDGGPTFTAVFVHPYPDDGTLRVAYIGPARSR